MDNTMQKIEELKREIDELHNRSKDTLSKDIDNLFDYLIDVTKLVIKKKYSEEDKIFELAKTGKYPKRITELAESFGMMIVKVEARELRLRKNIHRLKKVNERLKNEIDERKRAENTIRIFSHIINNINLGISVYQLENPNDSSSFRFVAANPAFKSIRISSIRSNEGMTLNQNIPELKNMGIPERCIDIIQNSESQHLGDIQYSADDDSPTWFSLDGFPLPNNCVGLTFRNITERKTAEKDKERIIKELKRSLSKYEK